MLDREIASELFGHQLVLCTEENFQGYSLDWGSSGQDGEVIYTHVKSQIKDAHCSNTEENELWIRKKF